MSTAVKSAIAEVVTRLQAILTASGFNTNAGNQVFKGERNFDDSDTFPALSVFSGPEEVTGDGAFGQYDLARTLVIEGWLSPAGDPADAVEDLIEDIQKALELTDITLGSVGNSFDYAGIDYLDMPEGGSSIAKVGLQYVFSYERSYGA